MFHNNIYYSDEPILSSDFCNELITKFENNPDKHPGYIGASGKLNQVNQSIKKSTDLYLNSIPAFNVHVDHLIDNTIYSLRQYQQFLEEQSPTLSYNFIRENTVFTGFNLQRTDPDGYFKWHSDDYQDHDTKFYRGIAYIWYLNTVAEGGTTEFYDGTVIHPKQGHLLLFPSTWTYVHRGVPPVNQSKYIITGWWNVIGSVHYPVISA